MRGDAHAHLMRVRAASAALEPATRELRALIDARDEVTPWQHGGGGSTRALHSDPTATSAQSRIDGLAPAIAEAEARIAALEATVADGLATIEGVRLALGSLCADVLELYYIDLADTWSEVARELGCPRSTACRARDRALAWYDRVGHDAAQRGVLDMV